MKIGDLNREIGVSVETIRFYEREGLLPPPARTPSNYRVYTRAHAERLRFIVNCRALDMTLEEIRALLAFNDQPTSGCDQVNRLLDEHISHVAERISELRGLERQLKQLGQACRRSDDPGSCGILRSLRQPAATTARAAKGQTHRRSKPA